MMVYYNLNRLQGKTVRIIREHFKSGITQKDIMAHIKKNPCMPLMPTKKVSYYEVECEGNTFYVDAEIFSRGFFNHLMNVENAVAYGNKIMVTR